MKRILITSLLFVFALPALATDVGVSVTVGQPGFYGHIEIGNFPRPRLIYREPMIIHRQHVSAHPVYLHVPPGHAKNWAKHCHRYRACARPVYFVESAWYEEVYVPEYQRLHGHPGKGKGKGKKKKD